MKLGRVIRLTPIAPVAPAKYRRFNLMLTRPTLPVRKKFLNALPATFVPMLVRGQGGPPDAPQSPYRGTVAPRLAPVIQPRKPWER